MTFVAELLAKKSGDVATVSQHQKVSDAVGMLKQHGIGALVVTGATPPLVGIISERDIVRALATDGASVLDKTVADLMTSPVTTCELSSSVTDLMGLMTANRIRHLPVVEDNKLVGMVSIGDVVFVRFSELESEKKTLLDYVSSW